MIFSNLASTLLSLFWTRLFGNIRLLGRNKYFWALCRSGSLLYDAHFKLKCCKHWEKHKQKGLGELSFHGVAEVLLKKSEGREKDMPFISRIIITTITGHTLTEHGSDEERCPQASGNIMAQVFQILRIKPFSWWRRRWQWFYVKWQCHECPTLAVVQ